MALEGNNNGDIRATLTISRAEAMAGTNRNITLPGGNKITVPIPPGAREGQEIRLPGKGDLPSNGGPAGNLILTIAVAPANYFGNQPRTFAGSDLPTEFGQAPQEPPTLLANSTHTYSSTGKQNASTKYPPPGQDAPSPTQLANLQTTQTTDPGLKQGTQAELQQPQKQPRRRRGPSTSATLLLLVLALLLIGVGSLTFYTAIYQPNQQHAQATATAQASIQAVTRTAQAQANATARVEASATAQFQATATAIQNVYTQATSGSPTLNDPLRSQDGNNWDTVDPTSSTGGCTFTGQVYHAIEPKQNGFFACFAQTPNFNNFAFQVQMTIVKGDYGGIIFRADSANTKYYYFRVGQNGAYDLTISVDNSFDHDKLLRSGTSSTLINTGTNQTNTLAVVAKDTNIYLFVNNHYLDSITDSTYKSGAIGVFSGDFTSISAEATFTNAKVWIQ